MLTIAPDIQYQTLLRDLARRALRLERVRDVSLLAPEIAEIISGIGEAFDISQQEPKLRRDWVNHHHITRYISMMLKNVACPSVDFSFRQSENVVQSIAELE